MEADEMKQLVLLVALGFGAFSASAQEPFDLRFDHSTVLVHDLEVSYLLFLRDHGVEYSNFRGTPSEPQIRPDGVRQVYLQDPDGNWIEINDAAHSP
jgi:catechol 2,3-dioxygenase-like lactoylglutathione lyase family enzyme